MGDLTFVVPPAITTTAPAPEASSSAGPAAPRRCRRVHFPDLVASSIWLPPAASEDAMTTEEAEPPPSGLEKETGATDLEEEEDRMDLLWEDFNEELLAMRRAGGGSGSCSSESSDGEGSDSAAGRGVPGCFPVLRPSARAGGAGHYRRRAGTWVLLMRIFRRLFVIDKTVSPAAARRRVTSTSAR